jgi:hypothetical protein
MQLSLHPLGPNFGSTKGFLWSELDTYTRSLLLHPILGLSYEQMFPSSRTSTLAQRTLDALRLTRSFLLLEDDHHVDWEVDRDEPNTSAHPHRAPLRVRAPSRRPGQAPPAPQHCVSPLGPSGQEPRGRSSMLPRREVKRKRQTSTKGSS